MKPKQNITEEILPVLQKEFDKVEVLTNKRKLNNIYNFELRCFKKEDSKEVEYFGNIKPFNKSGKINITQKQAQADFIVVIQLGEIKIIYKKDYKDYFVISLSEPSTLIQVSLKNWEELKNQRKFNEDFNDVISRLLENKSDKMIKISEKVVKI